MEQLKEAIALLDEKKDKLEDQFNRVSGAIAGLQEELEVLRHRINQINTALTVLDDLV